MLNGRCFSHVRDNMAKVKRAMEEAKIEILVGYPSGMTHIETTHKVNPETGERVTGTRDGGDLAELAEKLHYGTADIPSRPFLEDGLNENQDELRKELSQNPGASAGHRRTISSGVQNAPKAEKKWWKFWK